jgi:hypothetical protein
MRQIIINLGLRKITYRPRSKKLNEAITTEFISEVQKKSPVNPNHLFVIHDEGVFCVD